ncbi:MAG: hypothetical protein IJB70_01370 [Clostridia bacterium]|nr:hypothetical protein [Clostridia bacterium]
MFYKVENEQLISAPEKGIKIFIANPTPEQYALVGYTDKVIEDEIPEEIEGKMIESYYEQTDGIIYHRFRLVDVLEEEEVTI